MKQTSKFITFEGGEGAGKTTLIEALFSHFKKEGVSTFKTRAPGGTKVGSQVRDLLLHKKEAKLCGRTELFLFLADRAQHVEEIILPALEKHQLVLCDRFNDSTIAYQGEARGFGRERVKEFCSFACGELIPNLTIYLDIDPAIGLERASRGGSGMDKIESEALAFHQKIRGAFHQTAKEEPTRFKIIDASLKRELVLKQALAIITPIL